MIRIEEYLRNSGKNYDLRVLGEKEGMLHIEVKTYDFDGDGDTEQYLVKDNILFPINTENNV